MCAKLCWVDVDGCGWGFGYWVIFVSNVSIMSVLRSRATVLRLEPSMIAFSSIFYLVLVMRILSPSIGYGI